MWNPGERNGTFRGNNPAFVTATAALRAYWDDAEMEKRSWSAASRSSRRCGTSRPNSSEEPVRVRGRGLAWGLDVGDGNRAVAIARHAFERGLVETSGPEG